MPQRNLAVRRIPVERTQHVQERQFQSKKNVIRHLPGGDASLWVMNAPHSVPVEAAACGRSEELAIAVAQCQRT